MTALEFGNALIETGDLDPVYVLLHRTQWPAVTLKRWLIAYWWYYDMGTASWIASQDNFYAAAQAMLKGGSRGSERRHFRGAAAEKAISAWAAKWPEPESAIDSWPDGTFAEFAAAARKEAQVGPWIVYKMADMTERVLGRPLQFPQDMTGWYSEPRAGAAIVAQEWGLPSAQAAVEALLKADWRADAPPRCDRPIGVQEVETICCKYKSHKAGRYQIGKDSNEVIHSLRRLGSPLGMDLLRHEEALCSCRTHP